MPGVVHQIDPAADTVLLLKNPGAPFAVWETEPGEEEATTGAENQGDAFQNDESEVEMEDDNGTEDQHESTDDEAVQYLVSSRHLALASGYFKSSLAQAGWMEGNPSEADGMYHLTTTDWDPEALLIMLNILHLQNRKIPHSLSLEMVAKMAVLTDYYRCGEAMETFTGKWLPEIAKSSPVPTEYNRNLILWMFIAWVFKLPIEFDSATRQAISENKKPTVHDMGLPIPKVILDKIEHERYRILNDVFDCVQVWHDKWSDPDYQCTEGTEYSFTCSSVLLGALTKEMSRLHYNTPRPEIPFDGMSVALLCDQIRELATPCWYDVSDDYYETSPHSCSFDGTVKKDVANIKDNVRGLSLNEFKDRAEDADAGATTAML